ncbi:uncharacterized protein LOC106062297 [Biomphalaria glabrata]|uniref:Uncharacterized protein LOC106062297 n=1 Tax=Biomphalaria glabrata TaxID=6526 RepID=A0A9U8E7J6_BIOGL|nr:uncharacterized protein LOC106062297 [Biomphalaria glabrata]
MAELHGDHETQECEIGEADLHKYMTGCKKNPGHEQFIPISTFSVKQLPKGFRDSDLFGNITAVADLTVKIDVKMTSLHRPEVWPKTNHLYPFYNTRGNTNLRSGMIVYVDKFLNGVDQYGAQGSKKCWCTKCEHSDSPSNVLWELVVFTASHVVFDDIEASHTSLKLFYDKDGCPEIVVDKVRVDNVNVEYDRCKLKCVTCDQSLGQKLETMRKYYRHEVQTKFDHYSVPSSWMF